MISRSTLVWAAILIPAGAALFQVKYAVQDLEGQLSEATRRITEEREAIHILKAEWSYLNDPARIQGLVERHREELGGLSPGAATPASIEALEQAMEPAPAPVSASLPTQTPANSAPPPPKPVVALQASAQTQAAAVSSKSEPVAASAKSQDPYAGAGTAAHVRDLVSARTPGGRPKSRLEWGGAQ